MQRAGDTKRAHARLCAVGLLTILFGVPLGCGGDDKFAAETDDEYTEQLANAVIGTPTGVITVSPTGAITTEAAAAGKAGAPGAGGSAGSGGSAAAGAPGAGGSVSGGVAGGFAEAGSPDTGAGGGFGSWHFDDCSPSSHFLADASGFGANAQQPLKAACVPGINGLGVQFRSAKDVVQVPDEPQFTVGQHVGVAAWVNPKTVSGDHPIVIKRLNNKTAFSLGVHNGNIEMSVVLSTGKTVISRAPIAANKWTHVAGMFDGTFVFLFINGQQFGQVFGAGTVGDVFAPIRIGATTQSQFFNGTIDEVFLTTQTITSDVLTALSCFGRPSTLTIAPPTSGAVAPGTPMHYDVIAQNNDVGACQAKPYSMFFTQLDPGISANFDSPDGSSQTAAPGTQAKFGVTVTGSDDADPGLHSVPFLVDSFGVPPRFNFEQLSGQLNYELLPPTGCFVTTRRELMITHTSVVDDPIRTAGSFDPGLGGPVGGTGGSTGAGGAPNAAGASTGPAPGPKGSVGPGAGGSAGSGGSGGTGGSGGGTGGSANPGPAGVWSFGYLMRQMAPTPEQAPAMTLKLLQHWLSDQTINGFKVAARPAMQQQVIDVWPKTSNGELDLDRSPLTLQAIVNRIDTRNLAEGTAGEGRFVFGVNGVNFQNFTVIVEYNLVAHSNADVLAWANRWHALGSLPFPSEQYNAALESVTRLFTDRGASPGSVNGSALNELRTNEIALSFQWELRAFSLSSTTGMLAETTVKETPDLSFNNTATFADFVNKNAAAIIAEVPGGDSHTVPLQFAGQSFMGGSVFNNQVQWNGPGIKDPEARFHASLNTCNGCHSPESGTFGFLMVTPRFPGSEAQLSPFLTGTSVRDIFSGQVRTLNDLKRRKADLTALVCPTAVATLAKQ